MRKIVSLFLSIIFPCSFLFAQTTEDSLRAELGELIENTRIPGIGVSIASEKGLIFSGGFGYRDLEQQIPYDSLTVQPIASISKVMIAMALMKLVEEGKADLQADINTLLPFKVINPRFPKAKITLLQLATHTSSINDTYTAENASYFILDKTFPTDNFPKEYARDYKHYCKTEQLPYQEYLKAFVSVEGENFSKRIFGKYTPGEKYQYSNVGATLAAYIVELLAGKDFASYTEEVIFEPLGMRDTRWKASDINSENCAQLYFPNRSLVPAYYNISFPSSTLHSSSLDMGKFMQEVIKGYKGKGQLLQKDSYRFMLKNQLADSGIEEARGIFWNLDKDETNMWHTGSNMGITTRLVFSPDLGKAIFLMENVSSYEDDQLMKEHYNLLRILGKYGRNLD